MKSSSPWTRRPTPNRGSNASNTMFAGREGLPPTGSNASSACSPDEKAYLQPVPTPPACVRVRRTRRPTPNRLQRLQRVFARREGRNIDAEQLPRQVGDRGPPSREDAKNHGEHKTSFGDWPHEVRDEFQQIHEKLFVFRRQIRATIGVDLVSSAAGRLRGHPGTNGAGWAGSEINRRVRGQGGAGLQDCSRPDRSDGGDLGLWGRGGRNRGDGSNLGLWGRGGRDRDDSKDLSLWGGEGRGRGRIAAIATIGPGSKTVPGPIVAMAAILACGEGGECEWGRERTYQHCENKNNNCSSLCDEQQYYPGLLAPPPRWAGRNLKGSLWKCYRNSLVARQETGIMDSMIPVSCRATTCNNFLNFRASASCPRGPPPVV